MEMCRLRRQLICCPTEGRCSLGFTGYSSTPQKVTCKPEILLACENLGPYVNDPS